MRRGWTGFAFGVSLVTAMASVAGATSGTCTITGMVNPTLNLPLFPPVVPAVAAHLAMPVEFDETGGQFSMSRDAWYDMFGELGAKYDVAGPTIHAYLRMFDGSTPGTIDANGQIVMPEFPITSSTDYNCGPGCNEDDPTTFPAYPVPELDAMTGLQVRVLAKKPYVIEGSPVDFATGMLRLYGVGFLSGAVGGGGTNLSGIDIRCTLAPIPTAANLPKGATIAKLAGKVKVDSTPTDGDKGDQLTLKATLAPGATAFDLTGASPFILRVGGVTLVVQKNAFKVAGKKLLVKRDDTCKVKKGETTGICKADGSTSCTKFSDCEALAKLEVVEGQKAATGVRSQVGGQLAITNGKKGAAVVLKLQGLDLSTVTGAQTVRVAVGRVNARKDVTVSGTSFK